MIMLKLIFYSNFMSLKSTERRANRPDGNSENISQLQNRANVLTRWEPCRVWVKRASPYLPTCTAEYSVALTCTFPSPGKSLLTCPPGASVFSLARRPRIVLADEALRNDTFLTPQSWLAALPVKTCRAQYSCRITHIPVSVAVEGN